MTPRRTPPRLILLAAFALILASCSCPQRIERLRRHCPECFSTATLPDTLIPPALHIDTILPLPPLDPLADTARHIHIQTSQYTLQINLLDDTAAHIQLHTTPDTIIRLRTLRLPAPPCPDPPAPWPERLIILLLILIIIALLRHHITH